MRSFSLANIETARARSVWATQEHNETVLNDALSQGEVILIFSVNNSRHFQGYARMMSRAGKRKSSDNIWDTSHGGIGGAFALEWLNVCDLAFEMTSHLRNPLNENLPPKRSRDGTELSFEVGLEICNLIDTEVAKAAVRSDKVL